MKRKILFKIPLIIGIIFLAAFVIMLLWNAIVPDLFHGPVIGFWQAAGLLLLSKLLFGGFRGRPHRNGWHRDRWRRKVEEKLSAMTPEDREKYFKERWYRYCYPREESNKHENSGAETAESKSK